MYYIRDIHKPNRTFLRFDEGKGLTPATYKTQEEANQMCLILNDKTILTKYEVQKLCTNGNL